MIARFFDRLVRGWHLGMACCRALADQPKLMLFPLVSATAAIALLATSFAPGNVMTRLAAIDLTANPRLDALTIVMIAGYALALNFIVIMCNAALVFSCLRYFETGRASLREGWTLALARLPSIAAWSVLGATVGLMLGWLQSLLKDNLGFLGEFLGGMLQTAWAVVTYFVTPVLVVEGLGPIAAVKRSGEIMKKTWGETLGSEIGLGLLGFLMMIGATLVSLAIAVVGLRAGANAWLIGGAVGTLFVGVIVALAALSSILNAALYRFAIDGQLPKGFDRDTFATAFVPKQK